MNDEEPNGAGTTSAPEAKSVERGRLRGLRRAHVADRTADEALAAAVLALPEVGRARVVAAYVSRPGEPGTVPLLAALRERGVRVLLPVVLGDRDLDWVVDDGTRVSGLLPGLTEGSGAPLGPQVVADADVVVVPALAVDAAGRRLGQGGGSYDRALARRRADAAVVALLHDHELVAGPLPVEPHDAPVTVAVTPLRVVRTVSPPVSPQPPAPPP